MSLREPIPDSQGKIYIASDIAANDSDKTITVGSNERWLITHIWVELTSTATVGNRQLEVIVSDATPDVFFEVAAGAVQAASNTYKYAFYPGAARETATVNDQLETPIPLLFLQDGYTIRVYDSAAVDAAADDMVVKIAVQAWIEE